MDGLDVSSLAGDFDHFTLTSSSKEGVWIEFPQLSALQAV
jgi:hypothetical protein